VLSRCFEADGPYKRVEVIDDTLIEAVELRSFLLVDAGIRADGAEEAGGQWRVDAFEQLQEDETDRVTLWEELVAAGVGKLGDQPFGTEFFDPLQTNSM